MDFEQAEGISSVVEVRFPPVYAINERWRRNQIQQVIQPGYQAKVAIDKYQGDRVEGYVINRVDGDDEQILAIVNSVEFPQEFSKVLRLKKANITDAGLLHSDLSTATWERHPELVKRPQAPIDYQKRIEEVIESWRGTFSYLEENRAKAYPGLRPPQIGAIHAVHAHWTVSEEPATIVMPTGTGKTEAMLSVHVSAQCQRLLVVVPTDALRTQISSKFLTLGILKDIGVVSGEALYPIVGVLRHMPRNCADVDVFFERCNVVVTTMSVVGRCGVGKKQQREMEEPMAESGVMTSDISDETWQENIQKRMAYHCPFLFIDEAHHIAAQTWENFKKQFESARVLQFTATPFRNDERPVGGKIIFNYPMRKAQEEGYFRPIRFEPVKEYDLAQADEAIARKAVERLREDRGRQLDHSLMARVASIKRAEEIFPIYEQYKEFNPVLIHSGKGRRAQEKIRQQIVNGDARIIVCVDMLGEGFDLPELKIAAFHDTRKSLAVTLQLAGRFTRTKSNLGDPTFVANIANTDVQEKLSRLYAQDADWNMLLRRKSEDAIGAQVDLWEFLEGFKKTPKEISFQNLRPPMNFITYRTECEDWTPDRFFEGIQGAGALERLYHDVNHAENTLVIVLARKVPVDWAQIEDIYNWNWELYVLFWDKDQDLLFIAGSHSGGNCRKLAQAVAGFSFVVPLCIESDLNREVLSLDLRQRFEDQGIILSPNNDIVIMADVKNRQWIIHDSGFKRAYTVGKEGQTLKISAKMELIRGHSMFRCFHGIDLLSLHNVGLTAPFGRHVRYTMRAGSNVGIALTRGVVSGTFKSNIYGSGHEHSERTGLGCSRGGKVWSPASVNLRELTDRCRAIGQKLLDETIDPDRVLEGTLKVDFVQSRPSEMPITIEWPLVVYKKPEVTYTFAFERKTLFQVRLDVKTELGSSTRNISDSLRREFENRGIKLSARTSITPLEFEDRSIKLSTGTSITSKEKPVRWQISDAETELVYGVKRTDGRTGLYDVYPKVTAPMFRTDIRLKTPSKDGDLLFEVSTGNDSATFIQTLFGGYRFSLQAGQRIVIKRGDVEQPLEEWFEEYPPVFHFADGSFLQGDEHIGHGQQFTPYLVDKIVAWNWTGIDITQETQGLTKKSSSIQYHVIQRLKSEEYDYDIIYNDDGSGEAADVVAVRVNEKEEWIKVKFYHCKFSKKSKAGYRVSDLYEVCGQAQKSIRWMERERRSDLFSHLLKRDPRKKGAIKVSRFEKGDRSVIEKLLQMSKSFAIDLEIFIVQPGLSKAQARIDPKIDQLRILSVTESYLMHTYEIPFGVIASE